MVDTDDSIPVILPPIPASEKERLIEEYRAQFDASDDIGELLLDTAIGFGKQGIETLSGLLKLASYGGIDGNIRLQMDMQIAIVLLSLQIEHASGLEEYALEVPGEKAAYMQEHPGEIVGRLL